MTPNAVPEQFEIDIDRAGLLRYMRLQGLVTFIPFFLFFGAFFGLVASIDTLKQMDPHTAGAVISVLGSRIGIGLGVGFALGAGLYLMFIHRGSRLSAQSLSLRVDGMFLHIIRDGIIREDRKIHFNKITDYAVIDGPLMRRCGIRALSIACAAMRANSLLVIPGVVDAERIRDLLCVIDREREDRTT